MGFAGRIGFRWDFADFSKAKAGCNAPAFVAVPVVMVPHRMPFGGACGVSRRSPHGFEAYEIQH